MFGAAILASALVAQTAQAENREAGTVGKVTLLNRKAIDAYQHLDFDGAVRMLNEALDLSERAGLTQHPIRARTFVNLGIVTMGAYKDRPQALKYFRKGLQIQPEIRMSAGLANPEIQAVFDDAVAGLANEPGDELPPEKALVHDPVQAGRSGRPVPITVTPDRDLSVAAVVLRYRSSSAASFSEVPMQKGPGGAFEAAIPAAATGGREVAYFIEAKKSNGAVLVTRGSAENPMVIALASSAAGADVAASAGAGSRHERPGRFFFALLGGTGVGVASGNGEETRNAVTSTSIGWTRAGHLAPEIGYFLTPRFRLGVQARLQMVTGATPYTPPNLQANECGPDGKCSPFTGAFAALLRATWMLGAPDGGFQPYLSLSAGGGTIRHVAQVNGPKTCGTPPTETCMDTVAGGPLLFGPGFGFRLRLSNAVGLIAEVGALVGAPSFTANADVNVGLSFQL